MRYILYLLCWCSSFLFLAANAAPTIVRNDTSLPQQIHLAATESFSGVIVTWLTFSHTGTPQVNYSTLAHPTPAFQASGETSIFIEGKVTRFVHRVTLTGLQPLTQYRYQCGSGPYVSVPYSFTTLGSSVDFQPTFIIYGDFGYDNPQSLPLLKEEVKNGGITAVLHIGDLAYDLSEDDGKKGDNFMNQIQDIAAQLLYMVIPGNHENARNFSDYKNRFSMPGGHENIFYSWNVGRAHIIMLSTEVYFYVEYGLASLKAQFEWLEKDLAAATTAEALAEHPWIITMGHRPMYCSTTDDDDCDHEKSIVRTGLPITKQYALEPLFHKYGVDICLWAHEHIYERLWPIYDYKVMNGSHEHPYTNPGAPVHIVTGSAGCREDHDGFQADQPEWVAFTSSDYGYTKMTVHNSTHISFSQISDDQKGKVVDAITIIKEVHGPQAYQQHG